MAIVTAIVGGVISFTLAVFNSTEQRKLEERKLEEGRIIELLRTGSIERAKENLEFLIRSGLVQDARLAARVEANLKSKPKDQGPSLPTYDTGTTYPNYGYGTTHGIEFEGRRIWVTCDSTTHKCTVEQTPDLKQSKQPK